ncbi:MAG: Ig-like domain-containing protein, partial [Eudoraea sp.]|nr:Ig-like domain-containing protein [Eudoraea sp.]
MQLAKRFLSTIFLVFLLLATWHCAKRGSPTGGPKDTTPPTQIGAEPEEFSTEFESNKIRLYFDEYIRLQNPQDQMIISPPLKYPPLLSPQGGASKYVEVDIKDTLKENTTYTINFGQSIVDNNENNPAPFLSYVFSTGTYIDSLVLNGIVTDAFNLNPDEFISIMLYELDTTFNDSTIYQRPPNYISN